MTRFLVMIIFFILWNTLQAQNQYLLDSTTYANTSAGQLPEKTYYQYDDQDRLIKILYQANFINRLYISATEIQELSYKYTDPTDYTRKKVEEFDLNGNLIYETYYVKENGTDILERVDTSTYDQESRLTSSVAYLVSDNIRMKLSDNRYLYTKFNEIDSSSQTMFNTNTNEVINFRTTKKLYDTEEVNNVEVIREEFFGAVYIDSIFYSYDLNNEVAVELIKKYDGLTYETQECQEHTYERTAFKIEKTTLLADDCIDFSPFQLTESYPTATDLIINDSIRITTLATQLPTLIQRRIFTVNDTDNSAIYRTADIQFYSDNNPPNTFLSEAYFHLRDISLVSQEWNSSIDLYPNPVSLNQSFMVSSSKIFDRIKLFSMQGRLVYNSSVTATKNAQIRTPELAGIYLVQLSSQGRQISPIVQLVIVE